MLVYILKSSCCLAAFYLFYKLLLSRDTFHRFNRFALLGLLVFSSLLPLVQLRVEHAGGMSEAVLTLEEMLALAEADVENVAPAASEADEPLRWPLVLLAAYLTGVAVCVGRGVYSLFRLSRLLSKGKPCEIARYLPAYRGKAVLLVYEDEAPETSADERNSNRIAPFSWMRYIVVSRADLADNGREILIHELAHIHHWHLLDLLIADICVYLQWFNPASWLLRRELQSVHEFEADDTVIAEGIDAKKYQLLLIKKAVGTRLYSMANSLNHSSLKKRITMMLKEKSNPWARAKYLYVLPLAAIAVSAFARPEVKEISDELSSAKVTELSARMQETGQKLEESVGLTTDDDTKTVRFGGRVIDDVDGKPISGAIVRVSGSSKGVVTDEKGRFQLDIPVGKKVQIEFVGFRTMTWPVINREILNATVVLHREGSPEVFEVVEEMPSFPEGGIKGLMAYLAKNIRYPESARKTGKQGRIIMQFIVETDGSIANVHSITEADEALVAEAVRVLNTMPKWNPGKQDGVPVAVKFTVPVMFKLPDGAKPDNSDTKEANPGVTVVGNAEKAYQVVSDMPEFPGGYQAMTQWLDEQLQYPVEAKKQGMQGRVVVQFVIDKEGNVGQAKVIRPVNEWFDAEAIRLINAMPKWKPGSQNGVPVLSEVHGAVKFQLSEAEVKAVAGAQKNLYIIDGKEMRLEEVNPDKIKSVKVLKKGSEGAEAYADRWADYDKILIITTQDSD